MLNTRSFLRRWHALLAFVACFVVSMCGIEHVGHELEAGRSEQAAAYRRLTSVLQDFRAQLTEIAWVDVVCRDVGTSFQCEQIVLRTSFKVAALTDAAIAAAIDITDQSVRTTVDDLVSAATVYVGSNAVDAPSSADAGSDMYNDLETKARAAYLAAQAAAQRQSIDAESVTPVVHVGLLAVAGVAFIVLGMWLRRLAQAFTARRNRTAYLLRKHRAVAMREHSQNAHLRHLVCRLQDDRDRERLRLARELHDELGSLLASIKLDIHWISRRIESSVQQVHERLRRMLGKLNIGMSMKSDMVESLYPTELTVLGLTGAIRELAEQFASQCGWRLELALPETAPWIKPAQAVALYRIAQESLTNVARHAAARTVYVSIIASGKSLKMRIHDDGAGFRMDAVHAKSLGIVGMKSRVEQLGGYMSIRTKPAFGCQVVVCVPGYPADAGMSDEAESDCLPLPTQRGSAA